MGYVNTSLNLKRENTNCRLFMHHVGLSPRSSQAKPLLKREICNLSPGRSISIDATFRIAKQSHGDASCIVFVLGEHGHIIAWAALRSDKWSNILPLLYA